MIYSLKRTFGMCDILSFFTSEAVNSSATECKQKEIPGIQLNISRENVWFGICIMLNDCVESQR